jgi:hypothetical protein
MITTIPVILACWISNPSECEKFNGPEMQLTQCIATAPMMVAAWQSQHPEYVVKTLSCIAVNMKEA